MLARSKRSGRGLQTEEGALRWGERDVLDFILGTEQGSAGYGDVEEEHDAGNEDGIAGVWLERVQQGQQGMRSAGSMCERRAKSKHVRHGTANALFVCQLWGINGSEQESGIEHNTADVVSVEHRGILAAGNLVEAGMAPCARLRRTSTGFGRRRLRRRGWRRDARRE